MVERPKIYKITQPKKYIPKSQKDIRYIALSESSGSPAAEFNLIRSNDPLIVMEPEQENSSWQ